MQEDIAYLGGGCFWCTEAVFQRLRGVSSVIPGYMGGHLEHPDYRAVCSGETGHAEVVQIHFDPGQISYGNLLEVFFSIHDPTTPNRQDNDIGSQYRSVIFWCNEQQRAIAQASMDSLAAQSPSPIVTQLESAPVFWPAEDYHRDYFRKNPGQGYCTVIIAPKVDRAIKTFPSLLAR